MAALAQNGDGPRADEAGAADGNDLHGLLSPVDDWSPLNGLELPSMTGVARSLNEVQRRFPNENWKEPVIIRALEILCGWAMTRRAIS